MANVPAPEISALESLLVSTTSVAIAEIGDKTQLLALLLACRFRRPWPIILGILFATLANHALAAGVGVWLASLLGPELLRGVLAVAFIAMGLWILVPDKEEDAAAQYRFGAFLTTLIAFFLVEMGDKTQVATVVLAANYSNLPLVVLGTTLGMLAANVPVVLAGGMAAQKLPLTLIRRVAAALFLLLGGAVALGYGGA